MNMHSWCHNHQILALRLLCVDAFYVQFSRLAIYNVYQSLLINVVTAFSSITRVFFSSQSNQARAKKVKLQSKMIYVQTI